jgi:hypothetical protein
MANQLTINIGAAANDGTGDPLRTAFNEVNLNFANVWATGLPNSNVQFNNNRILTVNTNANLILAPNGVGVVQSNVSILPNADRVHNLGSTQRKWDSVYAHYLNIDNFDLNGDLTVGGNLTVEGDTIQIGNIVTDTKTIQLSNTAASANAANGSGITVGANDNIATFLYNSASNVWATNIGANITGNVTAPYFFGNGSQLTGLPVQYGNANVVTLLAGFGSNTISTTGNISGGFILGNLAFANGLPATYSNANAVAYGESGWAGNIIPAGNAVYSLGNATNQWNDLYVSNATIFMNNVPISLGAGNVLTVGGNAVLQNNSNTTISTTGNVTSGNVLTGGIVSATGNISGNYFIGNGSQLTGLSTSRISNGTSNVAIPTANGNATITANAASTWTFGTDSTLTLPAGSSRITSYGQITIETDNNASGMYLNADGVNLLYANSNVTLRANSIGTNKDWNFGTDGNLTLPGNIIAINYLNGNRVTGGVTFDGEAVIGTGTSNTQSGLYLAPDPVSLTNDLYLRVRGNIIDEPTHIHFDTGNNQYYNQYIGDDNKYILLANTGNVVVNTNDNAGNSAQWTFGTSGNLTLPMGGVVYETNIPDGALSGSAIALKPTGGTNADQQLLIYPTVNDANHLHLTTGNLYNTELFLGDDNLYVKLANTGNVVINSNDDVGNSAQWTFGTGGTTQFPNSVILAPVSQSITMQSDQYSQLMYINANVTVAPNTAINSNFYVGQNNATLDIVYRDDSSNQQQKSWLWSVDGTLTLPTAGRINFDYLSISSDANVSAFYAPAGNVQLAAGIGDAQIVASSLNDSKTWTFGNTGNLTAPGNVSAVGNITGGNLTVGSGTITGGNVNGANFNGNVAFGTGTVGGSGNITGGNLLFGSGVVSGTGNISAGNISVTGNISGNTAGFAIGYRDIPQVSFTANATLAATDAGRHYYSTLATANTLTIANNTSVSWSVGTAISIVNRGSGNITIAQGSGVSLYLAGNATAGNRTVTTYGMATLLNVAANVWMINGSGVS